MIAWRKSATKSLISLCDSSISQSYRTTKHDTSAKMKRENPPRLGKSPTGMFEIRWTENGRSKRTSTGSADLATAEKAFATWIFQRGKSDKSPAVSTILESYVSAGAIRERYAADKLIAGFGHSTSIDRITPEIVSGYVASRPSLSTARRELSVLVAACNHARRHHGLSANHIPAIQLPSEAPPREMVMTSSQLHALFEHAGAGTRIERFLWIATETASRRGAIEHLRWQDIDLENRVIRFDLGELGRGTNKRRVPVPISDKLLMALAAMAEKKKSAYVLGDCRPIYQAWRALVKRAAKATGDASMLDLNPHDIRRTWATHAARAGVPLWEIAGVLGDSLDIVTKHYAHHCPNHLRSAVNFRVTHGAAPA